MDIEKFDADYFAHRIVKPASALENVVVIAAMPVIIAVGLGAMVAACTVRVACFALDIYKEKKTNLN